MAQIFEKYPADKLELTLRKTSPGAEPEWRLKCPDCPGKVCLPLVAPRGSGRSSLTISQLYTPGPGESLSNYEVHLKNRQHRMKVNARLGGSS